MADVEIVEGLASEIALTDDDKPIGLTTGETEEVSAEIPSDNPDLGNQIVVINKPWLMTDGNGLLLKTKSLTIHNYTAAVPYVFTNVEAFPHRANLASWDVNGLKVYQNETFSCPQFVEWKYNGDILSNDVKEITRTDSPDTQAYLDNSLSYGIGSYDKFMTVGTEKPSDVEAQRVITLQRAVESYFFDDFNKYYEKKKAFSDKLFFAQKRIDTEGNKAMISSSSMRSIFRRKIAMQFNHTTNSSPYTIRAYVDVTYDEFMEWMLFFTPLFASGEGLSIPFTYRIYQDPLAGTLKWLAPSDDRPSFEVNLYAVDGMDTFSLTMPETFAFKKVKTLASFPMKGMLSENTVDLHLDIPESKFFALVVEPTEYNALGSKYSNADTGSSYLRTKLQNGYSYNAYALAYQMYLGDTLDAENVDMLMDFSFGTFLTKGSQQ